MGIQSFTKFYMSCLVQWQKLHGIGNVCPCFICAGVWIDSNHEVMYALASKITFICQMDFNAFPVDIQVRSRVTMNLINDLESWVAQGNTHKYYEYLTIFK